MPEPIPVPERKPGGVADLVNALRGLGGIGFDLAEKVIEIELQANRENTNDRRTE